MLSRRVMVTASSLPPTTIVPDPSATSGAGDNGVVVVVVGALVEELTVCGAVRASMVVRGGKVVEVFGSDAGRTASGAGDDMAGAVVLVI